MDLVLEGVVQQICDPVATEISVCVFQREADKVHQFVKLIVLYQRTWPSLDSIFRMELTKDGGSYSG